MIGDSFGWRKLLVNNFKTRLLIAFFVVVIASLLKLSTSFLIPILLIAFFFVSEFFIFTFTIVFLPLFWFSIKHIFSKKDIKWIEPPKYVKRLAKRMSIKIKKLGMQRDLDNAFVFNGNVIIGEKLKRRLKRYEMEAVIAHEFAHIKKHHFIKEILLLFLFSIPIISFLGLPTIIQMIAQSSYLIIILIPIMHYTEYDADKLAAKYVGNQVFKKALLSFKTNDKLDDDSETHPSIKKRIKNLFS